MFSYNAVLFFGEIIKAFLVSDSVFVIFIKHAPFCTFVGVVFN